jgi:hypothetical protein
MFCQDRDAGGTDLVGEVPVARDAVAAHEDDIDLPLLHHDGSHVVADEGRRNARIVHLERSEARALQERAGLVAVYVQVPAGPAVLECHVHRRRRGAVLCGRERSGIAVGEDPHALMQHGKTDLADPAADRHVLVPDLLRLRKQRFLDLRHCFAKVRLCRPVHPVQRPETD